MKLGYTDVLQAIAARINGVFDDPCLMCFGELSTNKDDDILRIIDETLSENQK